MNRPQTKILIISVASLAVTSGGAYALIAKNDSESVRMAATESNSASGTDLSDAETLVSNSATSGQGRAAPLIDGDLLEHRAFIESRWADGPNLADRYLQLAVPCGNDCYRLIIGDMVTGEIVDTGMGDSSMPGLDADSMVSSDLVLLSWINIPGANCRRGIYRWSGSTLEGVSDLLDFEYTDAGCAQTNLAAAMAEMD